jgi:hypothetical protein
MILWIGGEVEKEIYESFRVLRNTIEKKANENLIDLNIENEIKKIRILIIIRDQELNLNNVRYFKKSKIYEIEKSLPLKSFKEDRDQYSLLVNIVIKAIDLLPMNDNVNQIKIILKNSF